MPDKHIQYNKTALEIRVVHLLASSQLAGGPWATGGMASGLQMHRAPMSRAGGLL